jgi:hypothetical protein
MTIPSKSNSKPLKECTSGAAENEAACVAMDPILSAVMALIHRAYESKENLSAHAGTICIYQVLRISISGLTAIAPWRALSRIWRSIRLYLSLKHR